MLDLNAPNPYTYPALIAVETTVNGQLMCVIHEFSDLQQAWYWARDETGVEDFPFQEHPYGDHAGWEYMSFSFTKQEMEAHPEDEYEIFTKENADGSKIAYVISYKEDEEEEEEEEEEMISPPAGSPGGPATNIQLPPIPWGLAAASIPLHSVSAAFSSITAEDCFAAAGLNPHSMCPHGIPAYACMPCSH
jgi:hypothetical protein